MKTTHFISTAFLVGFILLSAKTATTQVLNPNVASQNRAIIRCADFNGDRKTDIFTANQGAESGKIFLNLAINNTDANSLGVGKAEMVNFGAPLADFAVCDLNRDKLPDLLVAKTTELGISIQQNASYANQLSWNNFVNIGEDELIKKLFTCDFNFDGYPEIVAATEQSLLIFSNDSKEKVELLFSEACNIDIHNTITALKCADMDGDGTIDIVACTPTGFIVFTGTPGTLKFESTYTNDAFLIVSGMDIGDLDGDYLPEVILSQWPENKMTIIRNISQPGRMAFIEEKPIDCLAAIDIAVTDYNQDGLFDIVSIAGRQGWGVTSIFINKTTAQGRFAFTTPEIINLKGEELELFDVDNNGSDDFIVMKNLNEDPIIQIANTAKQQNNFISFDAFCGEDGFAWLEWKMVDNATNTKYTIERTTNGSDFVAIGSVDFQFENAYSFTDNIESPLMAAYRIKAVGPAGVKYSALNLISPCDDIITNFVCVFPNPVDKIMNFQFSVKANIDIHFEVIDSEMQARLEKSENVTLGTRTYSLNIDQLDSGSYLLVVRFGNLEPKVCRFEKL